MKKIAYIELDTHSEIASNFIDLMKDRDEFSVHYFFSQKIASQLQKDIANWQIVDPNNLPEIIKRENYDLVIIGTVHRYFGIFKQICENNKTALIVHNQNFEKTTAWRLFKNVFKKETVYRLKLLLKESLLSAPEIYKKANFQLVLDQSIKENQQIFLPLFYTKNFNQLKNPIPKIAVPGAVSQQRRNYFHILQKLKKFKNPAEVIFLGKASGEELEKIREFKSQIPQFIDLKYYTEKIPQKKFNEILFSADVLWCPLQSETEFFSVKEIYGKTKMTGNIGDAIVSGKPAIFPHDYRSDFQFIFNEEEDVEQQIHSIIENFKFDFRTEFNKEKIRKNLLDVLNELVNRV